MHETKWIFFPFSFPSPFILDIPGVQVCTWGGLPLFSSVQAAEAKNASFALMSDVFMRGLQCHPPWGSCEVAAHVCGAIYSMMKWGYLCWFRIYLPFLHTLHTLSEHVFLPPQLYCDCMSQLIPACIKNLKLCVHSDQGWLGNYARLCHQRDLLTTDGPAAWRLLSCFLLEFDFHTKIFCLI